MEQIPDVPLDQLRRSTAAVVRLVEGVRPDQWSGPTPCDDWAVRRLVAHLVGMDRVLTAQLTGSPPPARSETADDQFAAAYARSSAALLAAFGRPGVLDQTYAGPLGRTTGVARVRIRLYDLLAHGWDLARATGQPTDLPEDAAEASLAFAREQVRDEDRPGRFAPAVPVDADAPALDRLVAFLGRSVGRASTNPATRGAGAAGKNGA